MQPTVKRRGCDVFVLIVLGVMLALPGYAQETLPERSELQDFHLLSENVGWVLLNNQLYWTTSGGASWQNITPATSGVATFRAVFFSNPQQGWIVTTADDANGNPSYTLLRTADGGVTWQSNGLSFFEPGDPQAVAEAVYLQFLDAQTGWIVVKQATSSNFNVGLLFKTTDGGQTWTKLAMPIGEPVSFATSESGWVAGGAAGNELYYTRDGGVTWLPQTVTGLAVGNGSQQVFYHAPTFIDVEHGVLPVVVTDDATASVNLYATTDGGQTWTLTKSIPTTPTLATSGHLPLSVFNAALWTFIAPDAQRVLQTSPALGTVAISSSDHYVAGIQILDMASPTVGWAQYGSGTCTANANGTICTAETRLLRTSTGGTSWTALTLPGVNATSLQQTITIPTTTATEGSLPVGQVNTITGQGFDKCEIPSLSQLQNWVVNSPYRTVNLYIGGSSRACGNSALNAAYLEQLKQQGWTFIPTWVGPQAACTSYRSRMSSDQTTAYNQGVSEADAALAVAARLGLTGSDQADTIIYYDLEAYTTGNTACRQAAQSFISGWTKRLQEKRNRSGVYGSTCGSGIANFASIANVPDAVWPAAWIKPYQYRSNASVFGLSCLSNTLWNGHQRIRQYAGGHAETWGNVSLTIDSNVLDGIVAVARGNQPDYAAQYVTQANYPENVVPSQDSEWWIEFKNTGTKTWYKTGVNAVKLGTGTYSHNDIIYSDIYHGRWQNTARPALMTQDSVAPGQVARFAFPFHVPANASPTQWSQNYNFTPVAEGITWIKDSNGNEINAFMKFLANGAFAPDGYESNDTESAARLLALNFTNDAASQKTTGANLHNASDVDFYKLDLPVGYTYTITARLHNSWYSSDGQKYSGDTKYLYNAGAGWSGSIGAADGAKQFQVANGGRVLFKVDRYAPGNTGTYALELTVTRTPISTGAPDLVVTAVRVTAFTATSINYTYTLTNIGTATATNLSSAATQAYLSADTIFNNSGDIAAGGRVMSVASLVPGQSVTESGTCGWTTATVNPSTRPYLVLMVDYWNAISESNETNNTKAALIPVSLQAPTGLSATDGTYTDKVRVTWNNVAGASHYRVYRSTSASLNTALSIGNWQTSAFFDDFTATPGVTYYYWVKAAISNTGLNASAYSGWNAGYRQQVATWHTITTSAGFGGQINPSGAVRVNTGGQARFAIVSRTAFTIQDIVVDGRSIYAGRGYTYRNVTLTISNVRSNHTVRVFFKLAWLSGIFVPGISGATTGNSLGEDPAAAEFSLEPAETPEDLFTDEEIAEVRIVASAGAHGTIFPDGTVTLDQGTDQTFSITPENGYAIQDVLVDGVSVGNVDAYVFSEISTDHTIQAIFTTTSSTTSSYFGFEEYGGRWQDVNKSPTNPDDDWMCWAIAAANILDWTGWAQPFFDSAADVFGIFQNAWTNAGGLMEYAWQWWFDGTQPPAQAGWSEVNNGGGYQSQFNFADYFQEDWATYDPATSLWSNGDSLLATIDTYLHSGFGTTLAVYTNGGGHALTVWGYEFNESGDYTGLWVTDSDDAREELKRLSVSLNTDTNLWYLDYENLYGYEGWFIGGVQALAGAVPEPGSIVLVVLGFLSLVVLKRRRTRP